MNPSELPDDVRALLRVIDSFEKLRLLCLLIDARADRASTSSLASELGTDPDSVAAIAAELEQGGIVHRTPERGWRYAPSSTEQDAALRELARIWEHDEERRLRVIQTMSELAMARIRSAAARSFAGAFVFRSRKKAGPA